MNGNEGLGFLVIIGVIVWVIWMIFTFFIPFFIYKIRNESIKQTALLKDLVKLTKKIFPDGKAIEIPEELGSSEAEEMLLNLMHKYYRKDREKGLLAAKQLIKEFPDSVYTRFASLRISEIEGDVK